MAVEAGFGKWGDDGIIENEKYGTNFLISAVFINNMISLIKSIYKNKF